MRKLAGITRRTTLILFGNVMAGLAPSLCFKKAFELGEF
jgi:hypothetical protein